MTVKVTDSDLILLGHGSYHGGADNITLPPNIDLYILQPVGYTLYTDVAEALIDQETITQLKLVHTDGESTLFDAPASMCYGGKLAPNLTLYPLGELEEWGRNAIGSKTNVVTVNTTTSLADLLESDEIISAKRRLASGKNLKLYWSACANQISGYSAQLPD